jgi:hypothetical protein
MADDKRILLRHFLAALAYRTQKALRATPPEFSEFRAPLLVRTPQSGDPRRDDRHNPVAGQFFHESVQKVRLR